METTSFRHLLESFCSDSPWNYAVFWKLQQFQDEMRLIYEDGFYDDTLLQQRSQNTLSRFVGEEDILDLRFVPDLLVDDEPELPIPFTNDGVSMRQYLLGQGVIGRAALNGSDLWLCLGDAECTEQISYLEDHGDEWLLPVSTGIKTTFTTPIMPYGVFQFGSLEKVVENFANVADIKERIFSLLCTSTYTSSNVDETSHSWSSIMVPEWENKDESSVNLFESSHFHSAEEFYAAEFADIEMSASYEVVDRCQLEDVATNFLLTSDMDISRQYLDLSIESDTLNDFTIPDIPEAFENVWTMCCSEEEHADTGISSDSSPGVSSYVCLEQEQPSPETENDGAFNHKLVANVKGSPGQSDPEDDVGKSFVFKANVDSCDDLNLSMISSCGWFDEGGDHDYLLDAAVASLYENTDDTLTCMFNCSRSTVTSLAELAPSFQVKTSVDKNAMSPEDCKNASKGQSAFLSHHQSTALDTQVPADSYECFGSPDVKDEKPTGCEYEFSRNNAKMSKHKKGRDVPKINLRPRPRDRQLIQDRLKQLRKLVPVGSKNSIDGLLEQTTKHMTFLRSVVEQAKKVKHFTDEKSVNYHEQGFLGRCGAEARSPAMNFKSVVEAWTHEHYQNKLIADQNEANSRRPCHTNSAPQEGKNTDSCPIIVTDMEHPGQFLIQMLCNSDEVFFEMTDVMRQLNLSILQGVMEAHRNNWARFVVEASEGFNKLDIFWPLMRILQRNGDWMTNMSQWCA